jgi:hypothetical protein
MVRPFARSATMQIACKAPSLKGFDDNVPSTAPSV